MSGAISSLHFKCVDFLKNEENRKNLSIAAGVLQTAITVASLAASSIPFFSVLCIGAICGTIRGLAAGGIARVSLKILDGGYQKYPHLTNTAAIVASMMASIRFMFSNSPFGSFLGGLIVSYESIFTGLLCGAAVYHIASEILDYRCSNEN